MPFTTRMFVPCLFNSVEVEVSNTVQMLVAISSLVARDIVRQHSLVLVNIEQGFRNGSTKEHEEHSRLVEIFRQCWDGNVEPLDASCMKAVAYMQ